MSFRARQGRAGGRTKHSNTLRSPDPVLCLYEFMPEPRDLTDPGQGPWVVNKGQDEIREFQGQVLQKIPLELWRNDIGEERELRGTAVLVDEFTQ